MHKIGGKKYQQTWWERNNIPFTGDIFKLFILKETDEEEQRVQKLREKLREFTDGKLSIERAKLVTESYKKTEGEPPVIRKAKAFHHIMSNISIEFQKDELIVGNPNSGFGKVEIDPEYMSDWLDEKIELDGKKITELRALKIREYNRLSADEKDLEFLEKEVFPYWKNKTLMALVKKELKEKHPEALDFIKYSQVVKPIWGKGYSHTIQDYNSVLKFGLKSIKMTIDKHITETKDLERKTFYEAMKICADALIIYATRCASKTKILCKTEKDKKRVEELRKISEICEKVPAKPAETFWEALQCLQFLHTATFLAEGGVSHAMGRLDQYLYPYLKKDLENDVIDKKKAQELLECFFLKFYEFQTIRDFKSAKALAGDRTNDKITISGVDSEENDVTNELSYMILEAFAHVHLKEPNISVRIHQHTSRKFLMHVLEVIRLGSGMPIPLNDDVIIPSLVNECSVSLNDARNYADLGCQENIVDPNTAIGSDCNGHNNAGWFNLPKVVEITLNNGINPSNGKRVGPRTGNPKRFLKMNDFINALKTQIEHAVEMNVIANQIVESCFLKYYPTVFHNLMHPNTLKNGLDYNGGGCKYNWVGAIGVGIANAGDSLCAINRGVFVDKEISWKNLMSALKQNWKGFEDIHMKCINYPKYGADDDEADKWVVKVTKMFFDAYKKHKTKRGAKFVCGLFSMGMYLILGEDVGATPDGRMSGEILASSVAGSKYAPKVGLTATHKSAAKLDTMRTPNGLTFNQILTRHIVSSERDLAKWAALLRTYFDLGGQTVQYSITTREDLIRAQKEPEKYKDLIVRVGGYSAVFINLPKEIQEDIIERSYD
ncbi:MAG: pyruvate formate lyase family protein [bacterium]